MSCTNLLFHLTIFLTKDFTIPDQPNIPANYDKNFNKKWMTKTSLGMVQYYLNIIMLLPFYLEIIPNLDTQSTLKE
jgi:hypothetical protein